METYPKYFKAVDQDGVYFASIVQMGPSEIHTTQPSAAGELIRKSVATFDDVKQYIGGEIVEIEIEEYKDINATWTPAGVESDGLSSGTAPNPQNIDGAGGADQQAAQSEPAHDGGSDPSPVQDAGGADTSTAAAGPAIEQVGPEPETNAA